MLEQLLLFDTAPEQTQPESVQNETTEQAQNEIAEPTQPESSEQAEQPATKYYDIDEKTARHAWEGIHMSEYKTGSATAAYRAEVDEAAEIAERQKQKTSPFYHDKIDHLLASYSKRLAEWYNKYNRNSASCPSWFITGPANYPTRKHEKQMQREGVLWQEYEEIQNIKNKIRAAGTGAIDLADPHARDMLQDRLDSLQAELDRSKQLNAYYRKHKTFIGFPGMSNETAEKMTAEFIEQSTKCAWITNPVPAYELTSLRDKIKRTQDRLAELEKRQAAQESGNDDSQKFDGGEIIRNTELDRLQIIFDEIPSAEMRDKLKSNGFRWSPKNQAWQRQLTGNAEYALQRLNLVPQN